MKTKGCELCGDFPVRLIGRCHPTAPLIAEMTEDNILILRCYIPECSREVARLKVDNDPEWYDRYLRNAKDYKSI